MAAAPNTVRVEIVPPALLERMVHSEEEVLQYAKYLGIDTEREVDLLWIARKGLCAPVPAPWWVCKRSDTTHLLFYNPSTLEVSWDHPCDAELKQQVAEAQASRVCIAVTLSVAPASNPFSRAVTVLATKMSGESIEVRVASPQVTAFSQLRRQIEQALQLPSGAVASYLLQDGTLLGHRQGNSRVAEVLGLTSGFERAKKVMGKLTTGDAKLARRPCPVALQTSVDVLSVGLVDGASFSL